MNVWISLLNFSITFIIWSVLFFIFVLLHELAHAIMYKLFTRDKNWSITIGMGRPMIKFKKLTINAWFMMSGYFSRSKNIDIKFQHIIYSLAGGILNLLSAGAIYFLILHIESLFPSIAYMNTFWFAVMHISLYVNLWIAFFSLIPMRYPWRGNTPSDGLRVYYILTNKIND